MLRRVMEVILVAALALPPVIAGGEERTLERGELLYETHCIACHDREVHWRDGRLVSDWRSLRAEVRRWQAMASLGWTDDEIDEVARFLQLHHYRNLAPD